MVAAIPMPLFCKGTDGRYIEVNELFLQAIGMPREAVIGHTVHELFEKEKADIFHAADVELWEKGGIQEYESEINTPDGGTANVIFHKTVIAMGNERAPVMIGAILDITQLRKTEARLQKAVRTDDLTGLHNRKAFMEYLDALCSRAHRQQVGFALLALDLDGFKVANDKHGHAAGDAVLQEVAARFRTVLRETDYVARIGGDEFMILLEGVACGVTCEKVADKVIDAVRRPILLPNGHCIRVGVSIGGCLWDFNGTGCDGMVSAADVALYQAKTSGRGRFCLHPERQAQT